MTRRAATQARPSGKSTKPKPKPAHTPAPSRPADRRRSGHATRTTWKKGQSGNLKGGPKRGESWAETITKIGNMTGEQAADFCRLVGEKLAGIGGSVSLKEAVTLRCFAALMFEPQASMLTALADRAEGKVADRVAGHDGGPVEHVVRFVREKRNPPKE